MRLTQQQRQTQALLLTQKMRQSLRLLQLPAPDLESYLEEEALSNPLLEVEPPALGQALSEVLEAEEPRSEREESLPIERREQQLWSGSGSGPGPTLPTTPPGRRAFPIPCSASWASCPCWTPISAR